MAPLFQVIMKYLVVTPFAREEFQDAHEAVDRAKELIMKSIANCRPTSFWWARIICLNSGVSGIIICPHVGLWRFNGSKLFGEYL